MIHFGGKKGSGGSGGGGGGGTTASVNFSPSGGSIAGTSVNVTITVSGAPKLRWRINSGAYTTANSTSAVVAVPLTLSGNTLSADALSSAGVVLASRSGFYQKPDGGQ